MFAQIIAGIVIILLITFIFIPPILVYGFWKGLGYLALVVLVSSVFGIIFLWALVTLGIM